MVEVFVDSFCDRKFCLFEECFLLKGVLVL